MISVFQISNSLFQKSAFDIGEFEILKFFRGHLIKLYNQNYLIKFIKYSNMKNLLFLLVIMATQFFNFSQLSAQNADSTTVFGYVVPGPKLDSNGQPKRVFKPAFKRIGFTTGALIPLNGSEAGGTSGIRLELGMSNKWSILADFQGNRSRNNQDSTFSGGQAGLTFRTMPFASRRLQPYFGAGWAIGGGRSSGGGKGRNFDFNNNTTEGVVRNYAVLQTGVNYIVWRRVIASVEGNYQVQIGGTNAQKLGGASAKIGLAYQFGKRK
jgi:hypothetical protein